MKKGVLKNFAIFTGKHNKVASLQTCNFIKKDTPVRVLSCGQCEIFKSTYFEEHLQTAASICHTATRNKTRKMCDKK